MSLNRFDKRRDANEPEIVEALRRCGAGVWRLDTPADLLVGFRGRFVTMEVKDGSKPPSARKLTPDEQAYAGTCAEKYLPHHLVTSVPEALAVILP